MIYNPLFIYGDSGLGKTHLLNAIRNKLENEYKGAEIVYLKCDDFVNDMVRSLQSGTMNEFKDRYRKADVLLVDDIQFISKSESFQEEFFHTFNALYEAGKQIILTSDRRPMEIPLLTERLRTRFEQGLIADIQSPDYELRIAIIRTKLEPYRVSLSEDIIFFLAEKLKNNVRQLEGVIKKLMAFYDLTNTMPTLALAQDALTEIMNENIPVSIIIDKVLVETSRYFEVSIDDLKSKKRTDKIASARQIGMFVLSEMSDLSLNEIGKEFGDKDHSTVHHSIKVVTEMMKKNPGIRHTVDEIIGNVKNK
jgi:chromosomal replication initiator protein